MKSRESILSKIEKLMKLGKSDNQHEAELAMSRANDLMETYQISFGELDIEMIEKGIKSVANEDYNVDCKMTYAWINTLGCAAAELFDGLCVNKKTLHGNRFTFVGFPEDVVLMKATFEHLFAAWQGFVIKDLKEAKQNASYKFAPKDTMKFKLGHGQGYAASLRTRIQGLVADREVNTSMGHGTSIVLFKKAEVKKSCESWVTYSRTQQSTGCMLGKQMGSRAANSVALGGTLPQTQDLTKS
jgi:hypothetical protein